MKILAIIFGLWLGYLFYGAYTAPHTVNAGWFGFHRRAQLGYNWNYPNSLLSYETVWVPGSTSESSPHLTSGSEEGAWLPDDGYLAVQDGASPVGYTATWTPGIGNPSHSNIHSGNVEGVWEADSGYQLAAAGSLDAIPIPAAPPQQLASTSSGPSGTAIAVGGIAALACALNSSCRNFVGDVAREAAVRGTADALTK